MNHKDANQRQPSHPEIATADSLLDGLSVSLYTDAMAKHRRILSNPRAGRETAD